jgi:hypothetical protein
VEKAALKDTRYGKFQSEKTDFVGFEVLIAMVMKSFMF